MKTEDLIAEAMLLPIEDRAVVVDSILKSLNAPTVEIDRQWSAVAQKRLAELRAGKVRPISGGKVFQKIAERYSR